MSEAHFDVETTFDRVFPQKGSVTINRDNGLVTVRPLHSRKVWVVPLAEIVTIIVQRAIKQEIMENKKPRKVRARRGVLAMGRL